VIVGTAGHIDHGKTALLQALTGQAGDRRREERERGMTIDLGYLYAALEPGAGLTGSSTCPVMSASPTTCWPGAGHRSGAAGGGCRRRGDAANP
jgi:translation initiation factor 2 gamma subunit (eIF-2gamma)